jgi:hypothetical protein
MSESQSQQIDPERRLVQKIASFKHDPLSFVIFSFPWGKGELKDFDGPDSWQKEVLEKIRDGLLTLHEALRFAVASGNGPGKSALSAWLMLWALSTMADTRGVITANTENQLRTKTWAELAKWHRLFIAQHWFHFTATAIYSVDPKHEKTWRVDQVPWTENRSEAFAGLHNKGKRIIVIFDEASAISDTIWDVTEGALTDENTEILWFVFGNPTRNDGKFHECFTGAKHRWNCWQIDIRNSKLTNKEQIQKWVDDYGEDSDFVRVRVRGVFPNISDRQFIPNSYVEMARGKGLPLGSFNFAARIIAVEPAWTGGDEIVIGLRQGNMFKILAKYQKNDNDFILAGYIANFEDIEKADAVFVDMGYGTGIISAGKQMRRNWILVPFGGTSNDPGFLNKRAEMWNLMKQWLKEGGAIPNDPVLCAELTGPEYYVKAIGANAGKIVLEAKEDMKKRGLSSPNRADCLALTFALPVTPRNRYGNAADVIVVDSQEYAAATGRLEFSQAGQKEYDPLK